jgi:hypothetical protein
MQKRDGRVGMSAVRRKLRAGRHVLQTRQANRQDFESRLLWIFGSPRSGSTWLLRLLSEHHAVRGMNEPQIGAFLGPFVCDLPGRRPADLDVTNCTLLRLQRSTFVGFFADQFDEVWNPALGRLIRERLFAHACRLTEPLPRAGVLAIKEPNGSQSADVIMGALPTARLLFLLRDGRDVVDSELAAHLRGSWLSRQAPLSGVADSARTSFVTRSAYTWLWRTEIVQEAFERHQGPKHLVRYEDLVGDPHGELRKVFDWLKLAVDDTELRAIVDRNSFERASEGVTGPREFFRAATPGLWRENLLPAEQAVVEDILTSKVRELGYK